MILNTSSVDVTYRFEAIGDGIKQIYAVDAPDITMTADSELKTVIHGRFHDYRSAGVDFLTDELHVVININGEESSLGYYIITGETIISDDGMTMIEIEGYSRLFLLKQSRIEERLYFAAGTLYTDALYDILTEIGITNYYIEDSELTLSTDRADWEVGTDRLTIINELLAEMSYSSAYVDNDGFIQLTPAAVESNIEYLADRYSVIGADYTLMSDRHGKPNVFIVNCSNPDLSAPLTSIVINDSDDNQFSTVYRPRVVQVTAINNIASQEALDDYAYNLMAKSLLSEETVTFETMINPQHTVGDVVSLGNGELSGIYTETGWSMALNHEAVMQHTARRQIGHIVINKLIYNVPSRIHIPGYVLGGKNNTVKWSPPVVVETITSYTVERSVDGGEYTQVYQGAAPQFVDTLVFGTATVQYRVTAHSGGLSSHPAESPVLDIINSYDPVISGEDDDIGTITDAPELSYTVTNPDGESEKLTIIERIDNTVLRTFTATSGSEYTVGISTAWQGLSDGQHTITIDAVNQYGITSTRTYTLDKGAASQRITQWTSMITGAVDPDYEFASAVSLCAYDGDLYCAASRVNLDPYAVVFKLVSGTWQAMSPELYIPGRGQDVKLLIHDGTLYLAVAREQSQPIYTWYLSGGAWVAIPAPSGVPTGQCWGCSLVSHGGTLYAAYSHNTSPYFTTWYLSSGTWVQIASPSVLPTGTSNRCELYSHDGVMYLAVSNVSSPYLFVYKWNGSAWQNMTVPTLPATATTCAFCVYQGVLLLTVTTFVFSSTPGTTHTFALSGGVWTSYAPAVTLTEWFKPTSCCMCVYNGRLYMTAGADDRRPNNKVYIMEDGEWELLGVSMTIYNDIYDGDMAVFDGKLYLAYGTDGGDGVLIYYGT